MFILVGESLSEDLKAHVTDDLLSASYMDDISIHDGAPTYKTSQLTPPSEFMRMGFPGTDVSELPMFEPDLSSVLQITQRGPNTIIEQSHRDLQLSSSQTGSSIIPKYRPHSNCTVANALEFQQENIYDILFKNLPDDDYIKLRNVGKYLC